VIGMRWGIIYLLDPIPALEPVLIEKGKE
jgi:hypothetical protein